MSTTLTEQQVKDIKDTVDELASKVKSQLNEAGLAEAEGGRRKSRRSKKGRKTRRSYK
jgi:hypothetical protein